MGERHNWSYASDRDREMDELEGPWEYDKHDKDVGLMARNFLGYLTVDLSLLPTDEHGWTEPETMMLHDLNMFERIADLLVPPESTPDRNRREYVSLMRTFRQALPYSSAERDWLGERRLPSVGGPDWYEVFSELEADIVSDGIRRVISGRDLLPRWWLWRRDLGIYSGGDGLRQARESLADLTTLLTPALGLPEGYRRG